MIEAMEQNLRSGMQLVRSLSDAQYSDMSVPPYHSSIGGHIRHVLDIYDCIFCGLAGGKVDLTARCRDLSIEADRARVIRYFELILQQLEAIRDRDMKQMVEVTDDLGCGRVTCTYTLGAALIQAHSHAIHHFAAMGYIVSSLGASLPDVDFGFNPTTPRETISSQETNS